MDGTWTIGELAERASGVLAATDQGQVSGRVRESPNDRLIRWYVTVGLVDPPLSRVGRVARYGRRHLLQLVAVKRRQAQGRSLAQIQAELLGATDGYLESVAGLPSDGADGASLPEQARIARPAAEARFWSVRPTAASATPAASCPPAPSPRPAGRARPDGPAAGSLEPVPVELLRGVRLAPGVLLLLDSGVPALSAADAAELAAAAAPLLSVLARQHSEREAAAQRAGRHAHLTGASDHQERT